MKECANIIIFYKYSLWSEKKLYLLGGRLLLQPLILFFCVKTGALFFRKAVVSVYFCAGMFFLQCFQQEKQGILLCLCACVNRVAFGIKAADVAYADAVGVMSEAMCTNMVGGPSRMHRPVQIYHIVVADAGKSALAVPLLYVVNGDHRVPWRGCAVDDDFVNTFQAGQFVGESYGGKGQTGRNQCRGQEQHGGLRGGFSPLCGVPDGLFVRCMCH